MRQNRYFETREINLCRSLGELKMKYPDKDLETIYLELAGRQASREG